MDKTLVWTKKDNREFYTLYTNIAEKDIMSIHKDLLNKSLIDDYFIFLEKKEAKEWEEHFYENENINVQVEVVG